MPRNVVPMFAIPVDEPFDKEGWIFEVKWDGYRAIAEVDGDDVRLYSRNLRSFNSRFPVVVTTLARLGRRAVVDGEIVVLDDEGRSQFQLLQQYLKTGKGRLVYYLFDLLYLDDRDLTGLPLTRRKNILRLVLPDLPLVRYSDHVEARGRGLYGVASDRGLEGIIAKEAASPYLPGRRSRSWLKIKIHMVQEVVVGGFTEPRGGRKHLGALVAGVYEGDELAYVAHVGGGFDEAGLAEMRAKLEPLEQEECPFKLAPLTNAPVHWVRPELVAEVKFQEWTEEGLMRQPVFIGLREDKDPKSVGRERPEQTALILEGTKLRTPSFKNVRFEEPNEPGEIVEIEGKRQKITNLDKVFWPEEGYTKGDLIAYYRSVAPYILPHLKDRPESLHRHPDGIFGQSFFHKNVAGIAPEWAETVAVYSEGEDREILYFLCQDEASLVFLANLGCVEINPWLSRKGSLDNPDYMVVDLDPEDISFDKVVEAALAVKETLDEIGAWGYPKTSGATGLHIYVPLGAGYAYDQAKQFGQLVAVLTHRKVPDFTSVERMPYKRPRKVYLDFLQNRRGQTLAAPYSVRPRPGAPVATPLSWDEVKPGLDPTRFTMATTLERLKDIGDIFRPVLKEAVDLADVLKRLD
ncbi:MAG: DNA ligase D [Candidatus Aquicultorales bacterium]